MEPNENIEQRIITAARKLFIEKGYVETNLSDIATIAGIKRPTLHYYFRTKERLFQTIYGDVIQQLIPRIQNILAQDIPFLKRLNDVIDEYITLFLKNPTLPQFVIGEIQRDMEHLFKVAIELKIDGYIRDIKKILTNEMQKGLLRNIPPRIIFLTLYSQMIFPFLTQNLINKLLLNENEQFSDFLQEWKFNILSQMSYLLSTQNNNQNNSAPTDKGYLPPR